MVIVLIAARYKKLLEWINNRNYEGIKAIYKIKNVGPKVFLYIDTSLDLKNIIKTFKKSISEQGGMAYVYEFYGIYNEKSIIMLISAIKLKIQCVIIKQK